MSARAAKGRTVARQGHVIARDSGSFECRNCGTVLPLRLPVAISEYVATGRSFQRRHRACRPREAQP